MKQFMKFGKSLLFLAVAMMVFASCSSVPSGHKGVKVKWGGSTNMEKVFNEGYHWGIGFSMHNYNVKEKTTLQKFEYNDKNSMSTRVEVSLDYRLSPNKVNFIHRDIDDVDLKIKKTLQSACKEVIPQYSAVELNKTKRAEAELKLGKLVEKELPDFHVEFVRLQITDVDLPASVAKMAEKTAEQLERNKLATEKKGEAEARAAEIIAKAKGEFEAAEWDAKRKKILSDPKLLEYKFLETLDKYADKGISIYGANNVFGEEPTLFRLTHK